MTVNRDSSITTYSQGNRQGQLDKHTGFIMLYENGRLIRTVNVPHSTLEIVNWLARK